MRVGAGPCRLLVWRAMPTAEEGEEDPLFFLVWKFCWKILGELGH